MTIHRTAYTASSGDIEAITVEVAAEMVNCSALVRVCPFVLITLEMSLLYLVQFVPSWDTSTLNTEDPAFPSCEEYLSKEKVTRSAPATTKYPLSILPATSVH